MRRPLFCRGRREDIRWSLLGRLRFFDGLALLKFFHSCWLHSPLFFWFRRRRTQFDYRRLRVIAVAGMRTRPSAILMTLATLVFRTPTYKELAELLGDIFVH
jgi:hypothetical protein